MDRVFRRKPTFTTAIQFDGTNASDIMQFCTRHLVEVGNKLVLETPDGLYTIEPGDFIVKGVANEFYPVKEHIFWKTYEEIVVNETDI